MARDHRGLRRGLTAAAGLVVMVGLDVSVLSSPASATTSFQALNGTVNAGADYVVYFTGVFSNFTPGVVNSLFPLSHSHLDGAPFSESIASPADTGNAGGTVVASWNGSSPPPPMPISQPQYAQSRFPPQGKGSTFGAPGGPYATANASGTSATASATAANTLSQGSSSTQSSSDSASHQSVTTQATGGGAVAMPAPMPAAAPAPATTTASAPTTTASDPNSARIAAFNAAIAAWRSQYMTPQAAAEHPMADASTSTPDGADGMTSSSAVTLDPSKGLISTGDARIAHASFGSGALVIDGLHISVTITNSGTPTSTVSLNIGDASVGGEPVSIGASGVTAGPGTVPADQAQQATAALNGILKAAGITVVANAPLDKKSNAQETITASALTVIVDVTGDAAEQKVQHSLGNVFVDDLALAAPATASLTAGAGSVAAPTTTGGAPATTTPVTSTYIPGTAGTPGTPGSPGGSAGAAAPRPNGGTAGAAGAPAGITATPAAAKVKPTWLLMLYLAWQALIIGAAASIWWWRSAARGAAAGAGR